MTKYHIDFSMLRLILFFFLFLTLNTLALSVQTKAESPDQDNLGQAITLHFEGKYSESELKLTMLPKTPTEEFPIVATEIAQILRSLNSIAENECADSSVVANNIKNTSITGENYEWIYIIVIAQAECLLEAGHPSQAVKFLNNVYPMIKMETTFTEDLDARLVRMLADGIRKTEGIESEARYVYEQAHRFDFSDQLKSELYERSIESFLEASLPEEALLVGLKFEEELAASDDSWFRDYPLSQILLGKAYADLELFDESEIAASKALRSFLTLKTSGDIEYFDPLNPSKAIDPNFEEYLTISDAYILNRLGLLLDRQWRFSEAAAAYQLGIKLIEVNRDALDDYGFYFDITANYSHTLSFMEGQEEKARRYLEKFKDLNSEKGKEYPLEYANILNALAILIGDTGDLEKAKETFIAGVDLLDQSQYEDPNIHYVRAQLLNNLATLDLDNSEIEHYTLRAIEDLKAYSSDSADLVQVYSNLGVFYLETNNPNKALGVLDQMRTSMEIREHLSTSINFLNAALAHQLDNSFLSEEAFKKIIDWNLAYNDSTLSGLSLKDIHVWLPRLQSRWKLAGNTFEGIVRYCEKYPCSDEFFFGSLINLIQSAEFSIISVAEQAKHGLGDQQKIMFVELIAKYFNKPNMVYRASLSDDITSLINELQNAFPSSLTNLFDKSQNFKLADGSKLQAPRNSAIVKFFDTGRNIYRLDITHNSKKLIHLSSDGEQIAALFSNLREKVFQSSAKEIIAELDVAEKLLFADLSFDPRLIDTVYYSPETYMRSIPPTLLSIKEQLFSGDTAIVTLPSFSKEFLEQSTTDDEYDLAFMGFGAPGFSGDELAPNDVEFNENILRGIVKTKTVLKKFPPLKGALEELRNSERIMTKLGDTLILSGKTATKRHILDLLAIKSSKLISFATHGVPISEIKNGVYPSLLFNADQSTNDDGLLSTKDVLETSINADVIYLSTCDSASANTQEGQDWEGFVNSFLFAGAKSVIASSWKIEDTAAKTLHTYFSENLAEGLKPRFAMANAIKELRENDTFSHPMYWGAFSIFGALK